MNKLELAAGEITASILGGEAVPPPSLANDWQIGVAEEQGRGGVCTPSRDRLSVRGGAGAAVRSREGMGSQT